jgi:hypothetical protein
MDLLFYVGVALAAAVLLAGLVFGVRGWQRTSGKIVALTSGVLLASLAAWVAIVLILVVSADRGAPM